MAHVAAHVREVLEERTEDELRERTGVLDPRGPAPHDDERQEAPARSASASRGLEAREHVVAERNGVVHPAERERVLGRALDAEEARLAPEREHEIVVGDRSATRLDHPRLQVQAVISAMRTGDVRARRKMERTGWAMSVGTSSAAATW
jgi:hypothetical protein